MRCNTLYLSYCLLAALIGVIPGISQGQIDLDAGLVAHYSFEGDTTDASGNGNDATAYNDYEYLAGVEGDAIRLVGSGHTGLDGGHVILPFIPLNEFPAFTISMWVNHQGHTSTHGERFLGFGGKLDAFGRGDIVSIAYQDTGNFPDCRLIFEVGDNSEGGLGGSIDLPYSADFADNWQHLVLRADNGTFTAFLNGQSVGSNTYELNSMTHVAGLGCSWFNSGGTDANRFIGMIDEVRIYDRALSQGEIEALNVPEPATMSLLALGGLALLKRRNK